MVYMFDGVKFPFLECQYVGCSGVLLQPQSKPCCTLWMAEKWKFGKKSRVITCEWLSCILL